MNIYDPLKNFGFDHIYRGNSKSKNIIAVIGNARGGTSVVIGALNKLGVFTGEQSFEPVFEDHALSAAFEGNNIHEISKIKKKYSDKHSVWAWKRPSSVNYLELVNSQLKSPKFIFIFKDIYSIGNRDVISMKMNLFTTMLRALKGYELCVKFIVQYNPEALLVSYEKVLAHKKVFIDKLCQFVTVDPTDKQKKDALNYIQLDSEYYLDNTRITKCEGCVETCENGRISGWAKSVHHSHSVEVSIFLNGHLAKKKLAGIYRDDLKSRYAIPNGNYGFDVNIGKIKPTDIVEVRPDEDIRFLKSLGDPGSRQNVSG